MTRPSGVPSGVKNPPLMAARPESDWPADRLSGQREPGPLDWSATWIRWVRESKETSLREIEERVVFRKRGGEAGMGGGGVSREGGGGGVGGGWGGRGGGRLWGGGLRCRGGGPGFWLSGS